jgi:hypothetical protein
VAALIALPIVWAVVSLAAFLAGGLSLGVATLLLGRYVFLEVKSRLKTATTTLREYHQNRHDEEGLLAIHLQLRAVRACGVRATTVSCGRGRAPRILSHLPLTAA